MLCVHPCFDSSLTLFIDEDATLDAVCSGQCGGNPEIVGMGRVGI